jgi:glycosyltransferase involved in cell wall biosynthesis
MGRPFARQVALDNAEGKYLAMLDADDFFHPLKLEKQVSTMEANPDVALVSSGMYSFGYNSNIECIRCKGNNSIINYKKGIASPVAHAASMLRLEIAKKYQYNLKLKLAQDVDFLSKYLNGRSYIVTDDVLYYYSEFDSVSITKILRGYYYSIVKSCKSFKEDPPFFTRYIAINLAKLAYGSSVYPFLGINKVLKKRGISPSNSEHTHFINLKYNLLNYR